MIGVSNIYGTALSVANIDLRAQDGLSLALDGGIFTNFNSLNMQSEGELGTGTVTQSGILTLSTATNIKRGTYTIASAAELKTPSLVITGGKLAGEAAVADDPATEMIDESMAAGKVVLTGAGMVVWQAGEVATLIEAAGSATLTLQPIDGTTLKMDGNLFTGFASVTHEGAGIIEQTGSLDLGAAGEFELSADSGHYILMTGGSISSKTFTMLSNTMFTTYGIVSVDIVGSEGSQIVTLEHEDARVAVVNLGAGNDQFLFHKGTLTANVDLGAGDDIVELAAGALDAGITIDGGENANDFDTLNYNLTSGSTLSSTSLDQLHNFERFNIQLMPGSSVASDFHLSANDDSLVWWGGATFTSVVTVDAQGGTDTLTLVPGSTANTVNITAIFSGFQVFEVVAKESREGTMFSGGNVDQSVDISLGTTGRATFSTGAYVIKDRFKLTTHTLRVDGGSLKREASGAGKVMLSGEDVEVIFSAGSLDVIIDGSMASGDVTLTLSPAMDVTIALDMDTLSDFTKLTQDGAGTFQQQGSLNLGASGEVTLSAGSYSIAANQLLTANILDVGSSVTLSALATSSASDVAGAIVLTGSNAELIYRGGTITTVIDATGATGGATFRINIADGDEATSPTGTLFSGFTKFIKEGLGTFTQKTNWGTGNTNEITIKEGTYILEKDLTLASVTFSGDMTKLEVTGTITGGITVIGSDSTSQTVRVFDGASLAAITLGEGDDTIEYTGGMLTENIYLGDGSDTFFSQGSTLNLATGKTIDGGAGEDTLLFDITGTITTASFDRFVSFERFHFRLFGQ